MIRENKILIFAIWFVVIMVTNMALNNFYQDNRVEEVILTHNMVSNDYQIISNDDPSKLFKYDVSFEEHIKNAVVNNGIAIEYAEINRKSEVKYLASIKEHVQASAEITNRTRKMARNIFKVILSGLITLYWLKYAFKK